MNFYDLVHCTVDGYSCLGIAPSWSGLKVGDIVRVDNSNSEMRIIKICTAGISRETHEFMRNSGVEIKRIMSKVSYEAMDYSEESDYDYDNAPIKGAEVSE